MNAQTGFLLAAIGVGLILLVATKRGQDIIDVAVGRKKVA